MSNTVPTNEAHIWRQAPLIGEIAVVSETEGQKTLVIPHDITAFESAKLAQFLAVAISSGRTGLANNGYWELCKQLQIERLFVGEGAEPASDPQSTATQEKEELK